MFRTRSAATYATAMVVAMTMIGAACSDDDSSGQSVEVGEIVVDDPGDGDRVQLPGSAEVGQRAPLNASLEVEMSSGGQGADSTMVMTGTNEVIEAGEGEYTVESTLESIEATSSNPQVQSELDKMSGKHNLVLTAKYAANGRDLGESELVSGDVPEGMDPADLQGETATVVFPDEPIGVGAVWTVGRELENGPLALASETEYELVELSENEYVVEVSGETPIDESVDGVELEGSIRESGTVRGDPTNPLVTGGVYKVDADVSGDGQSVTMSVNARLGGGS